MPCFRQTLTPEETQTIRALVRALEPFRALRSTMPLQYVVMFLLVALEEGLGVSDYGAQAGVAQSVATRHLLDIGGRDRYKREGFGLVTQRPDPMDLRKHQTMLTPKGKAVAHAVVRALSR